jgi:hypothetical protein
MSAPASIAIVLAIAIPLQLLRAYRVKDAHVEAWAHDHGLDLTESNRPVVARYLRRAQVARTWGGIAGVIVPSVIDLVFNGRVQVLGFGTDGTNAPLGFGTIFIGYLLGALYAEVMQPRPVAGAARKASLAPRELDAYLSRRVILAQRALTAVVALGLLAIGVVPVPASFSTPSFASLALAAAVVVAFGAALEAIERWLVRRPQPFTSRSLVATDDAIRAQSIHSLAGAGVALLLLGCSGVALGLQASEVEVLHVTMLLPAAVCVVLALFVWRGIGERPWRVRRPAPPAST